MKERSVLFVTARVVLTALFALGLLVTLCAFAVSAMFSVKGTKRALRKQELPALAMQQIADNVEDLQGIINVETERILETISSETVEKELMAYTDTLTERLLCGADNLYAVQFDSSALREMVESVITPELYVKHPEQLQKDRDAAYAEIVGVIDSRLAFFPQTLFDKVTTAVQDSTGITKERFYALCARFSALRLPALLLTLALGTALFFTLRHACLSSLRYVAGVGFLTGSAVFLPALFLQRYTLFERLSLSDGLLRRYVLCVLHHMRSALFTTAMCCFLFFLLFLAVTLFFSAKKIAKTCKAAENVLP